MDKLNPNELDEDEKDLIEYEKLLYFAADFNFESLDEGIENWKPEPEDGENTPAHWIVKKANLLSFFKINGYIESALTLLDDAEERIVTEKYSERLYFYEALRHYKFSATFKRSKKIDFQIKYLESKGLNPTGEIIKSFLEVKDQQKKIEPLGGDRHRYTTSIHLGISPEDDNYLRSFQLAHFLMEAGLPLRIRHTDLINKEREWWRCFKNLFKRYPFVALYYSFHYSDFGQDDKFFRRIGQEIAYSDELQDHLTEMFEGFTGAFNYFLEKQKYIKVDILYFISELFIALPNKTWDPFFEDLWRKFNNTDDLKKEIYPGYPGHGIYSFINKSLPLIENKRLLKEILLELINIKDKGERLKINYLANLTSNPIFESNIRYFQSPDVQKKIAEICQDIISKVEIPLKVLRNISELLSEHDRENILSHLKMFKKLSSLSNDIFPTIIYFSMSDTELHKELKSALIEKSNLWPTGINIEGGKAVNRTIGGSYIFPFHRIRKREDFKQGLEWSEDELSKIYKKLGESLEEIKLYDKDRTDNFDDIFLLKEMLIFLKDERERLAKHKHYASIYNEVNKRYIRNIGYEDISDGIASSDEKSVLLSLNELRESFNVETFKNFKKEWKIIVFKVLFKKKPKLDACFEFLTSRLKKLKESADIKALSDIYISILKSYWENPLEEYDKPFFEENLIKIAEILKDWGHEDEYIAKWLDRKAKSRFLNIKRMP